MTKPSLGEPIETVAHGPSRSKVGQAMPDFEVTTQDGTRSCRLSDLKGKVVAFTFIYTRCPLARLLPGDRHPIRRGGPAGRRSSPAGPTGVRLLSISFDPEHDTPEVLTKHAKLKGAKPPLWTFAVASHEQLRAISGAIGLDYSPLDGQIAHNLRTVVVAPDGTIAKVEGGGGWAPAGLLKAMLPLVPGPRK